MNFASQLTNTVVGYLANNDTEFKRLYNDMNDGRTGAGVVAGEKIGRSLKDEYNIEFEPPVIRAISRRITNEVQGVNRVVYDWSEKPPATIELE